MLIKNNNLRQVVASLDHKGTFMFLNVERVTMHSRRYKIPRSFARQSAAMLMASAMLLAILMCAIEGVLIPQVAQGQVVSGHVDMSSHEEDPNAPAPHSHGRSHSDESTDLCCTQILAMRKSAFQSLVVEGPVRHLGAGDSGC